MFDIIKMFHDNIYEFNYPLIREITISLNFNITLKSWEAFTSDYIWGLWHIERCSERGHFVLDIEKYIYGTYVRGFHTVVQGVSKEYISRQSLDNTETLYQ